jgi:penicillin-binding protein 1A
VQLDQISTYLQGRRDRVEDHRYYNHPGIDPIGLAAPSSTTSESDGTQGGSTITQQLARTLFLSNTQTYARKAKEAALAVLLEIFLTKREILELYLNRVFLSGGVYGVETMSQKMLRKPASQLTLAEAALIAGIIRRRRRTRPGTTSTRRRSAASSCCSGCARRRRSPRRRSGRARRAHPHPAAAVGVERAHGYAKEYLRQQFRNIYGGDNPPDWKVQTTFIPRCRRRPKPR